MKKRILSITLTLCMCASSQPVAYAYQEVPMLKEDVFMKQSPEELAIRGSTISTPSAVYAYQEIMPVQQFLEEPTTRDSTIPTPTEVYNAMIALKDQDGYKEGTVWTNDTPYSAGKGYDWKAGPINGVHLSGRGCAAFAFILSDAAFDRLPAKMYAGGEFKFEDIKVGDILRMNNDSHTVIVLEVNEAGVVIAEGNYSGKVHWERIISKDVVMRDTSHYITRYPEGYVSPDDATANEVIKSGKTGKLTWELTKAGTLTISGEGAMQDYSSVDDQPWKEYSSKIRKVVIKDGVTSIGNSAFWDCGVLSAEISSSVTKIGNSAFRGSSIISVKIPSNVKTIGDSAFRACQSLTSIALPASIEEVGAGAFMECEEMTSATFASGSKQVKMGDNIFARCYRLMNVKLPSNIDCISSGMFMNCLTLPRVEIPQGVESIKESAFASCSTFTTVVIPDSVKTIERSAFASCGLTDIYFTGTEAQWKKINKQADTATAVSKVTIHYNYTPSEDDTGNDSNGDNTSGDDTGNDSNGDNTSGDDTGNDSNGDNTSGDDTGNDSNGDNTSGDNTGNDSNEDNTSGDDTGNDSNGDNTSGDDTGNDSNGDNTSGDDTGNDSNGNDTSGDNTGNDSNGDDTGNDSNGDNTSGDDTGNDSNGGDTSGDDTGNDSNGNDTSGDNTGNDSNGNNTSGEGSGNISDNTHGSGSSSSNSSSSSSSSSSNDSSESSSADSSSKEVSNILTNTVEFHWVVEDTGSVKGANWKLMKKDGTYVAGTITVNTDGKEKEQVAWAQVNGAWYAFGADGYADSGWVMDEAADGWYYVDINSGMQTGWHDDTNDGATYFLDPISGKMKTKWNLIEGKWYYFNDLVGEPTWQRNEQTGDWSYTGSGELPFGAMLKGGITPDGYMVDENGAWINPEDNILTAAEFQWTAENMGSVQGTAWRLTKEDGTYVAGTVTVDADGKEKEQIAWAQINGAWYAFGADGYADSGWITDEATGSQYYIDINFGMQIGWNLIEGKWYYFKEPANTPVG